MGRCFCWVGSGCLFVWVGFCMVWSGLVWFGCVGLQRCFIAVFDFSSSEMMDCECLFPFETVF